MDSLVIPGALMDEMLGHAAGALPNEACGMLAGKGGKVRRVYRLLNSEPSPVSYAGDPNEQLKAINKIAADGMELIAIYHSHPDSPPVPSITDINRAFFPGTRELNYPQAAYVIIGLASSRPEVRAYMIEADHVESIEIVRA